MGMEESTLKDSIKGRGDVQTLSASNQAARLKLRSDAGEAVLWQKLTPYQYPLWDLAVWYCVKFDLTTTATSRSRTSFSDGPESQSAQTLIAYKRSSRKIRRQLSRPYLF